MSPVALGEVVLVVAVAAAVDAVFLLLLPHAASTNAPKLAAPAPPAIFRKRLRYTSSRTRRSTMPAGWGAESSLGGLDILITSTSSHSRRRPRAPACWMSGRADLCPRGASYPLFALDRETDQRVRR